MKKFSIPYNNSLSNEYLKMIEPYKDKIDSIFLSIPLLNNFNNPYGIYKFYNPHKKNIQNNAYDFLEITKGKYKRIIAHNSMNETSISVDDDIISFKKRIYPLIEKYEIDGFILTNYILLKELHKDFPWLSLQSSCNCMHYDIKTMDYWRKAGCSVFNPPRNCSLDLELLKKMHQEGFVLKLLVNENCVYGCPKMMNHNVDPFHNTYSLKAICFNHGLSDVLKTNLIMPEWLSEYDEFIDIYKLKGRRRNNQFVSKVIKAYMERKNPLYLNDFVDGGMMTFCNDNNIKIPSFFKTKKLLQCKCMNCESCKFCDNIIKTLKIDENVMNSILKEIS